MPLNAGIPVTEPALPGGPLNPIDWLSIGGDDFAGTMQESLMRGQPAFAAAWQRRQIDGPDTHPQPGPIYIHSRPYDRGAGAFSPKFGVLNINPIGAGVYAPYRIPTIAGPGARYAFGAIFFDVQATPTSMGLPPTMSSQDIETLLATSHVGAMYATTG